MDRLSIVIPAWNEGRRIAATLAQLDAFAQGAACACEVIIVDDGSTDDTATVVASFQPSRMALRLIRRAHAGKGACVREGMLAATGDAVLMTDADLSAPLDQAPALLDLLGGGEDIVIEGGADIVIGSRRMPDSVLDPPQPPLRRLMERTFRTLRRVILLPDIRDTQCGFKLFARGAAHEVFSRVTVGSFAFDCEALAIARTLGLRIHEVGILWRNHPDSRVRPVRDSLRVLLDLLRIRWRMREK